MEISRRKFLRTLGVGAVVAAYSGCKKKHLHVGPADIRFIEEPKEFWERVDSYVDNSLENGFSFDFTRVNKGSLEFKDAKDIGGEEYFLDAQNYVFDSNFAGQTKRFNLVGLRRNKQGIAIDVMGGDTKLFFDKPGVQKVIFDGKEHSIEYRGIEVSDRVGFEENYLPNVKLIIDGEPERIYGGKGNTHGLNFVMDANAFLTTGNVGLFVSPKMFSSRYHDGDVRFAGLEFIIESSDDSLGRHFEANQYNLLRQEDAYFRIDASSTEDGIVLRKADKLRMADNGLENFSLRRNRNYTSFVNVKEATSHDIEIKNIDRKESERNPQRNGFQNLEGDFFVEFSPPLEARINAGEISFLPTLFNTRFERDSREHLIRYITFDGRKVLMNAQNNSGLPWNVFYPLNNVYTEIIEQPMELELQLGERKDISFGQDKYSITLKRFEPVIFHSQRIRDIDESFPSLDFIFDVEKDGTSEEARIKTLTYGYSNRALGINIDPDVAHYWGKDDSLNKEGIVQRFFVSQKKFISAPDFSDDHRFSGTRKILIPDYETAFGAFDEPVDAEVSYQQVSLGNRYDGEIQEYAGFRVNAEFGINHYEKGRKEQGDTKYNVISSAGFDYSDQIKNGYIVRIKSFEKIDLKPKV